MSKLNRDVPMNLWGTAAVIPAGTAVHRVNGDSDYVVTSVQLLIELSGNTHDPIYRYVFVPTDAVEK